MRPLIGTGQVLHLPLNPPQCQSPELPDYPLWNMTHPWQIVGVSWRRAHEMVRSGKRRWVVHRKNRNIYGLDLSSSAFLPCHLLLLHWHSAQMRPPLRNLSEFPPVAQLVFKSNIYTSDSPTAGLYKDKKQAKNIKCIFVPGAFSILGHPVLIFFQSQHEK